MRAKYSNSSKIKKNYFDNMFKRTQGRCMICNRERRLVLDHNHKTDELRGLLCNSCNSGLGMFMDSPYILNRAITYILNNGFSESQTPSGHTSKEVLDVITEIQENPSFTCTRQRGLELSRRLRISADAGIKRFQRVGHVPRNVKNP